MSPQRMAEEEKFETGVNQMWAAVNLCRTAGFGRPCIQFRPSKRRVVLDLDFKDAESVHMSLPLMLVKQRIAKQKYLQWFADHDLEVTETINGLGHPTLNVKLDRSDENLGYFVTEIYKSVFDARDIDTVKVSVETLKSDLIMFRNAFRPGVTFKPGDYTFKAPSARHEGAPVWKVQSKRVLAAFYYLIYPIVIILSYLKFGLLGMCWAGLAFNSVFIILRFIDTLNAYGGRNTPTTALIFTLFSATLATGNGLFVQIIPSVSGAMMAVLAAARLEGILPPDGEKEAKQKEQNIREYRLFQGMYVLGGTGMLLANEWARRILNIDEWVRFFAFFRFEYMAAMLIVIVPVFAVFYVREYKR